LRQQRIRVHQDMVADAQVWNQLAQKEALSGIPGTKTNSLSAQAYLFECQIGLEQARAK
jgi:hypothetical protein